MGLGRERVSLVLTASIGCRNPAAASSALSTSAPTAINYEAVKIFMPAGSKQPIVVHYTEHCPPDVGAAFIWLKNRDPERWRDVQNVEHVMGKYLISDKPMTLEEWASARATVVNEVIDDTALAELPAPKKE